MRSRFSRTGSTATTADPEAAVYYPPPKQRGQVSDRSPEPRANQRVMSPLAACLALALACCSANAETIEGSHQPAQREAAVARREAAVAQREAAVAEREAAMAEQLLRGRSLQWGWAALPGLGGGPNAPPSPAWLLSVRLRASSQCSLCKLV